MTAPLPPGCEGFRSHVVDALGTPIHVVEVGEGPLVLFVHGFPESWYSWRHQLPVVAAAGFRAAAIDVRGYGASACPPEVEAYGMVHHVADNAGVVQALGETEAIIVGHDWGSPIAFNTALLRPDMFTAVALLSVPYSPRSARRPSEAFRALGGDEEFYIEYFQEPGRAEAEIAEDPARWLMGFYYSASAAGAVLAPGERSMMTLAPGGQLKDRFRYPAPGEWPSWLASSEFDYYVGRFAVTGLSGGLNRYRNADRDWSDLRAFDGLPIRQPSLFIGGDSDGPTIWGAPAIARFDQTMPNLSDCVIVEGSGHWVQQEAADRVNALLTQWLCSLR